ncbi:hypothetical protein J7K19_10540 [bacterium]|nr:hypothetical protein [bacterium]
MKARNVSKQSVNEAIEKGVQKPGNKPNTMEYHLPASKSSTGRGVIVVRNVQTGKIITVIDKGSKYKYENIK